MPRQYSRKRLAAIHRTTSWFAHQFGTLPGLPMIELPVSATKQGITDLPEPYPAMFRCVENISFVLWDVDLSYRLQVRAFIEAATEARRIKAPETKE